MVHLAEEAQVPTTDTDIELGNERKRKDNADEDCRADGVTSTLDASHSLASPNLTFAGTRIPHETASFTSSISTLMPDKTGLPKGDLPLKKYGRLSRNIRWSLLSVYRRLNLLVILPNILAIIILGTQHALLHLPPQLMGTVVSVNITISVLVRQDLVVNLLFTIFGKCPQSFPLRIRRLSAKIYHLGGVHSGAGIAATVWFGLYNVAIANVTSTLMSGWLKAAVMVITFILDGLLIGIIVLAHPAVRTRYHNTFEMVHRFAGWSTVVLFWTHFVLLSEAQRRTLDPSASILQVFVESPTFYCLLTVTVSLVLPWLRLRRVPVHAEPLSDHAIRLHFTYTNLPLCAAPRISDNPLKEWHAFAGIPEESGNGFSIIVSKAGDWTSKLIQSPPTSIWVRGIAARGVLHVAPIFKKLVLVATGSGIGPILSLLYARGLNCRILWSTPDPEITYQKAIIDHVRLADPDALIINTTISGRPDLVRLAYDLYQESDAEAIFIISNPRVTRKFVYALESRGIPTFAPIFDS